MNFNVTFVRWYYNASSCVCAGAWHEPSPTASEPRRPASTDDLTVEPRGELDRRRRTRSRGSFGALTLILQQVKRQVQKNIQECDSRVHSPSGAKSSLVPLSKTRGSVFCVVILVARRRRDLRGLVSGVDVCVCVLQRRRRAFLDSFPTHPSNIFESVRVARGGRSPSGTQSQVCDFTGCIYSPMSHQIGKEKPSRESSCVPRGESAASPVSPRIASLNPIPRVPNRGSGQWWPGARMENVVCCVCDAVGLSMPAGSRGRDGEIELVLCEIERVR